MGHEPWNENFLSDSAVASAMSALPKIHPEIVYSIQLRSYTVAARSHSKLKFYYRNLDFPIQVKVLLSKFKFSNPN